MVKRLPMQVRLSDEAREGWDRLAVESGATITALVESIGVELRAGWRPTQRAVKRARAIDRERHSRR